MKHLLEGFIIGFGVVVLIFAILTLLFTLLIRLS